MPLCEDCDVWSAASPPGRNFGNAPALAFAFVFVLATTHRLAHWLDAGFDPRCIRHGEQFTPCSSTVVYHVTGNLLTAYLEATPRIASRRATARCSRCRSGGCGAERERRGTDQHQLLVDHCCDCLSAISFSADAPHPEREWHDYDVAEPGSHTDRISQAALIPAVE